MKKLFFLPFILLSLLSTGCKGKKDEFKDTTIAVFADVQLANPTPHYTGHLRNHFKFCKENNVDVIMMVGDIVNNSTEDYYDQFESTFKSVYGEDESTYPEFVYLMGNHEWWNLEEKVDGNAINLFNKHARIDTKALVKRTSIETNERYTSYYPNYYKVVNGIPFIAISGESHYGLLSYSLCDEIESWLKDISKLPSVKKGGPIFVGYHYPIPELTYSFGEDAYEYACILDDILKNYPQAILFTGHTHFSAINERTINQVNYTNINLGSSSYTCLASRSATMLSYERYMNVRNNGTPDGQIRDGYDHTPTINIVKVSTDRKTIINRYFSASEPTKAINLGLEWAIPAYSNKDNFVYTRKRYQNTDWANLMYSKNGLEWKQDDDMSYKLNGSNLIVSFPDVIDYNYCEHYRVQIYDDNGEMEKYDFISHYFKLDSEAHEYNFEIKNIPFDSITRIEIYAFDFFDNISTNHLAKEI